MLCETLCLCVLVVLKKLKSFRMKKYIVSFFILLSVTTSAQQPLKLENENILAEFDPGSGALIHFENKQTGWTIAQRPALGQSFEMLVPLKEKRFHLIKGIQQKNPTIAQTGNSISFQWQSLQSKQLTAPLDITFKGTVTLTNDGLEYSGSIINKSAYTVEYLSWPCLGELTVPAKDKRFICQSPGEEKELSPRFNGEQGYWGVEYPTNLAVLPENNFLLIRNDEQGMYVYSKQDKPYQMVICSFELVPGYAINNTNPENDTMDGQMVRVQFKANHVVYAAPRYSVFIRPLSIKLYKGSWHKGADLYKQHSNHATSPGWIKEPINWQRINISNHKELINYALEAKSCGVTALQVFGWQRQNTQNNIVTIDSLATAIQACRRMGVHVILGVNLLSTDPASDRYNNELKNDLMTDPYGIVYNRGILCPSAKAVIDQEIKKYTTCKELQTADGVLLEDNHHRNKTYYCFNPNHRHRIPAFADKAISESDSLFATLLKQQNKDFAVISNGLYDHASTLYDGCQASVNTKACWPVQSYINNALPALAPVDVRTARKDINQCLLYRFAICYELKFYNNHLQDYPKITAYGKQVEQFRRRYQDYIWDGEFLDTQEAQVKGKDIVYTVYRSKQTAKRAVLICNQNEKEAEAVSVSMDHLSGPLQMASPGSMGTCRLQRHRNHSTAISSNHHGAINY